MHRVSRRKSVSSNSTNLAAVAQAVKEAGELPFTILPPAATILSKSVGRNSIGMGNGGPGLLSAGGQRGSIPSIHGYPSPPSSLPTNGAPSSSNIGSLPSSGFTFPRKLPVTPENGPSAITHGVSSSQGVSVSRRTRRASEGAHALLGGGGSTPGESGGKGGVELKCEKCGKGYKHSSCLTKHLLVPPSPCFISCTQEQEPPTPHFTSPVLLYFLLSGVCNPG